VAASAVPGGPVPESALYGFPRTRGVKAKKSVTRVLGGDLDPRNVVIIDDRKVCAVFVHVCLWLLAVHMFWWVIGRVGGCDALYVCLYHATSATREVATPRGRSHRQSGGGFGRGRWSCSEPRHACTYRLCRCHSCFCLYCVYSCTGRHNRLCCFLLSRCG
jgi:hypothetical protein